MKSNVLRHMVVFLAAVLLPMVSLGEDPPLVQMQNGVSYVSGGVGSDETNAIKAMGDRFNLHVSMTTTGGAYMDGGSVTIVDAQGHAVLSTEAAGPLFYAQLKPGSYTIKVSGNGKQMQQMVKISASGSQMLNFTWRTAEDASDPVRGSAGTGP